LHDFDEVEEVREVVDGGGRVATTLRKISKRKQF